MLRTRVGYAGGTTPDPTYRKIGDHTEVFQVDFDPEVTSYAVLVDVFWNSHNACSTPWSRQYLSILFYQGEEQQRIAERTAEEQRKKLGSRALTTEVLSLDTFTMAEDYHQKYYLRRRADLVRSLRAVYTTEAAFRDSHEATVLNAQMGGHLSVADVRKHLEPLGWKVEGETSVRSIERVAERVPPARR